jgi:hypothetical protein
MADARGAWNETGEKLTDLGRKLKVHYEAQHGAEGQQSRQELADAARRVGGALQDAFEAIGAAARDKSVQSDVKQVGQSLVEALGATLGQASEEVRRALAERKGEAAASHEPPVTPASPSATSPVPPHTEPAPPAPEAPASEAPASEAPASEAPAPRTEPWGTP